MLKHYSVEKLNRISKERKIWCWGCGKKFNDMLRLYQKEPFISRISVLIDGNSRLWGIEKEIGDRNISITSFEQSKQFWNRSVIILITTDYSEDIYTVISDVFGGGKALCCKYPEIYFTYSKVLQIALSFLPLRRQILFKAGDEPHENARAIVDYLAREHKGKRYKLIFSEGRDSRNKNSFPNVSVIYEDTLRSRSRFRENLHYCFLLATSKFLIYENEPLKKVNRRQKLFFLNHGTVPLKNVRDVLRQPDEVDFAICPSEGCSQIYTQQYGIPVEKQLYIMPPRTDFIKKRGHQLEKIVETGGCQVIIWLPTFRALKGTDRRDSVHADIIPLVEEQNQFEIINKSLCVNDQMLLIKKHPKEKDDLIVPGSCKNIVLLTDEELWLEGLCLHEILGDTSALITDYSGISFEYLLVEKPIGYVISDMEDYRRGFAYERPADYMPGRKIRTIGELVCFLDEVRAGGDEYKNSREKLVNQLYQGNEQKSGAKKFVDFLDNLQTRKKCDERKSQKGNSIPTGTGAQ